MTLPSQSEHWLRVVTTLRVDRKNGNIAPHKPLLLLVLAELAEQGKLPEPLLALTGELVFRFLTFWTVVADRRPQRPDIILPFYHLHSEGCWEPLDETGKPTLERRRTVAVKLDESFLACLEDGPEDLLLRQSSGRQILLPANPSYWPARSYLAWHRKHKFQGA